MASCSTSVAPLDVVIADDSGLFRQMLKNVLERIPGTRVVGVAQNGAEAVEMVIRLQPDVLTLDVHMPGMDGIAVLDELRRLGGRTTVIMVSSLTTAGAPTTVEALMRGAFDVVAKPAGLDPHEARRVIMEALAAKLALARESRAGHGPAPRPSARSAAPRAADPQATFAVLAIGASTGGPEALRELLPRLPADLPVPVLVVQHIPASFSAALAARLDDLSELRVVQAEHGMPLERGRIHLAPGGRHLRLERSATGVRCHLDDSPPELGCQPSFNLLLESACEIYGGGVLATVLTGMGADGRAGCRAVKSRGGFVVAQHREGCVVWGMPKAVEEEGLADAVLRLDEIGPALAATLLRG